MPFEAFKFSAKKKNGKDRRVVSKIRLRQLVRDSSIPVKESGLEGRVSFVKAYVNKDVLGKRPVRLVKKEYFPIRRDLLDPTRAVEIDAKRAATRDASFLKELNSIGCRTVPTVRFMVDKSEGKPTYYLLQTDLGFRNGVRMLVEPSNNLDAVLKRVSNKDEIIAQIKSDVKRANAHGIFLHYDSWLVQIDPKTKIGTPYLSDVGASRIFTESLRENPRALEGLRKISDNYLFLQKYWRFGATKH